MVRRWQCPRNRQVLRLSIVCRCSNLHGDGPQETDAWTPPHHPRWENQWKVLNVFFTTWDVDCHVTKLDIAAAKKIDAIMPRGMPDLHETDKEFFGSVDVNSR